MNEVILYSVISLGTIAAVSAMILFVIAKKFNVEEDPRIDEINELLPSANCGGCGYPGCRSFAEALIDGADKGDISALNCAPAGPDRMAEIGTFLGLTVEASAPPIAVLRCGGTNAKTVEGAKYDGPRNCTIAHTTFSGEKVCQYGCLGLGECVDACEFGAMYMDEETGLPVIIEEKCVGCGACAKACPRAIIEMRARGRKNRRVWVSCMSQEKGG
ncbi:RnfABCDGE type electron transport complex subunit B, partial [bacterium]|nr:RnfABCDGE type electron transport complex subunit B [bacterium]